MANTTKRAKTDTSKGSTVRGPKAKSSKAPAAKPKAPSKRSSAKTSDKEVAAAKNILKVKSASTPKKSRTEKTKIEAPAMIVLKNDESIKVSTKTTEAPVAPVRPTSQAIVDTSTPKTTKVEGEDTNTANTTNISRGPVKDVDVMLLGGKVIDLRPAEIENKPKNRKKLQWTPARRKYVAEYLADAQVALRLADWEITLQFGVHSDPDGDTLATMTANEDQRRATMRFGKEFFDLNPNEMRQTLIHEMLHCHMFPAHHNAERTVMELGGPRAGKAFTIGMMAMIETATDSIADAVAPFFATFELPER